METYLSRRRPAKKVTGNLQEVEYDDTRLNEAQLRAAIKALVTLYKKMDSSIPAPTLAISGLHNCVPEEYFHNALHDIEDDGLAPKRLLDSQSSIFAK